MSDTTCHFRHFEDDLYRKLFLETNAAFNDAAKKFFPAFSLCNYLGYRKIQTCDTSLGIVTNNTNKMMQREKQKIARVTVRQTEIASE